MTCILDYLLFSTLGLLGTPIISLERNTYKGDDEMKLGVQLLWLMRKVDVGVFDQGALWPV